MELHRIMENAVVDSKGRYVFGRYVGITSRTIEDAGTKENPIWQFRNKAPELTLALQKAGIIGMDYTWVGHEFDRDLYVFARQPTAQEILEGTRPEGLRGMGTVEATEITRPFRPGASYETGQSSSVDRETQGSDTKGEGGTAPSERYHPVGDPMFGTTSDTEVWYLAHPVAPDPIRTYQENLSDVAVWMRICFEEGFRVIAPYHTICLALDDENQEHRRIGLETDIYVAKKLGKIILSGHKLSSGMREEANAIVGMDGELIDLIEMDEQSARTHLRYMKQHRDTKKV